MKKIILTFLINTTLCTFSQAQYMAYDGTRYITVTGSAEVELQPDELELQITLKEFHRSSSNGKVSLEELENQFYEVLEANNISKDNVLLNTSKYNWYRWWSYRSHSVGQKTLILKVSTEDDLMSLVKQLSFEGLHSLQVTNTTSSKAQAMRKEIKIKAMLAAREKAEYLLESMGEEVGQVLVVQEVNDRYSSNNYSGTKALSNFSTSVSSTNEIEGIPSIQIRYEITAKFAIKE
ncbi:MAG: SIMPL domain-containing protein [Bacteroidota bacterium]